MAVLILAIVMAVGAVTIPASVFLETLRTGLSGVDQSA